MSIIQHPVSVTFYRNIRHTIKNLHTISRNMYDHTAFAKYKFDHLLRMWFFFFKLIYYHHAYFIVEKKPSFFIIIITMELLRNKAVCP